MTYDILCILLSITHVLPYKHANKLANTIAHVVA